MSRVFSNQPSEVLVNGLGTIKAYRITEATELEKSLNKLAFRPPFSMLFEEVLRYMEPDDIETWVDTSRKAVALKEAMSKEVWIPETRFVTYRDIPEHVVIGGGAAYGIRSMEIALSIKQVDASRLVENAISNQLYDGRYIQILSNPNPIN